MSTDNNQIETKEINKEKIINFSNPIIEINNLSVKYGNALAIENVTFSVPEKKVIALIGPSGCGKSTLIRCINRMNDLIPSAKVTGSVLFEDQNRYGFSKT